ncbi:MAG TPA: tRNA methyl transferase PRC-barrel domain-containing protein, partial [Candidatus Paceibacterota bacterium]|nr:tRNA methyl transferase PRC-barrel domain-containing protein [Candidatus Paceibacterota bacterium]
GVCFLGSVSVDDFLRAEFGTNPGHAVDESGHAVGAHDGVLLHTVGERVALSRAPEGPWYVVAKHIEKNELVVARSRSRGATAGHEFRFTSANWHGDPAAATEAQYRYRGPRMAGKISGERFIAAQALPEALTEGQSAVFYGENGLVGGGIIAA